ncbi:formyl transferase-domain-containing protein [Radiomyces spectabilis]|uniref:formyl transferase-domain-containing protein n=1 Tax=Radiomyces spectabilis TaxID=64574 RepID=UPI00221ED5BD|nr:formyl transferase-domain-containing protein [Radiomyces spectabilis]KAI8381199.1 formyl transferase-domain-containing protein [Radiomyces spectabilis]
MSMTKIGKRGRPSDSFVRTLLWRIATVGTEIEDRSPKCFVRRENKPLEMKRLLTCINLAFDSSVHATGFFLFIFYFFRRLLVEAQCTSTSPSSAAAMALPSVVVLISGSGTNLQALIDATQNGSLKANIVAVISNRKAAYGLERAAKAGIPTQTVSLKKFKDQGQTRVDFDIHVAQTVLAYKPDLVILAGWMHILSPEFLSYFNNNVMNLHPALPGQFDGAHAIERAFEAYQKGEIQYTGIMVHKVIPDVDRGQVILQRQVPIEPNDTLQDLETRIHSFEHKLIVEGAQKFLDDLQQSQ